MGLDERKRKGEHIISQQDAVIAVVALYISDHLPPLTSPVSSSTPGGVADSPTYAIGRVINVVFRCICTIAKTDVSKTIYLICFGWMCASTCSSACPTFLIVGILVQE
jgi:hypothetical protein